MRTRIPFPLLRSLAWLLPLAAASAWLAGCTGNAEAQGGGATLEGGDGPLALLFFVALLSLVDEVFTAGQHEIHHACELVRRGGVGAGLVHAAAQAAIECAERGVAV